MSTNTISFDETFHLEMGGKIERPVLAYSSFGRLNERKDNVTLVCHALTANSDVSDWWAGIFGPQRAIDPDKNFIICINNLGSPYGTSSPKSINSKGQRFGWGFPEYTIRDTAKLHILLLEHLGIVKLDFLIGGSCGGNIAQEIAYILQDKIDSMVLMCCSASETPWVISIHESQRIALESDSTLQLEEKDAGQSGLRGARAFAMPFYRSYPSFKLKQAEEDTEKMKDFKAASYVRYQGDKFVNRYDAQCYYKQLNALDTHNIGRHRGGQIQALGEIKAQTLVIGFSTDLLIPVIEQQRLAQHINDGTYVEIKTDFGHDAFLIETDQINNAISTWIAKR